MTKLASSSAELAALRALCSPSKKVSGKLLAGTDETYLHNREAVESYKRIRAQILSTGEVPSWRELTEDPTLSEDARDFLKESEGDIDKVSQADGIVRVLNKYRQLRGMYLMAEDILTTLQDKKVDNLKLLDDITDTLSKLRAERSIEDLAVHFGVGNNSVALVKDIIYNQDEPNYIPTGFRDFDIKNGGFLYKSLVILAGTSGGGKSQMASQLCVNWTRMGYRVVLVPLEMSKSETTARILANVSGVDVRKIILRKLTEGEQSIVYSKYAKFVRRAKAKGGRYTLLKPEQDMTIEEILTIAQTYGPKVVVVDYISLLKGVDDDDQWRKLGAIARYCKIWADTHDKIVVLLAQLSEDGKIRYAQAIKEHADYAWTFVSTKETRENNLINIEPIKGRNAELFPFSLRAQMNIMRIGDLSNDDREASSNEETSSKETKRAYDDDIADAE